jgi:hypothetical protein
MVIAALPRVKSALTESVVAVGWRLVYQCTGWCDSEALSVLWISLRFGQPSAFDHLQDSVPAFLCME